MLISVIVPVYNAEKYLKTCADSILSQSHKELELILVDDGSSDKSPQICDNIASKDDRVKVCHQKNSGVSGARNKGMELATGEYIAFVDNDDILPPNSLETFLNVLGEDSPLLVQGNVFVTNNYDKALSATFSYDNQKTEYVAPSDFAKRSGISKTDVWGKIYHKTVAQKYKFPLGHYGEDLYFNGMVLSDENLGKVLVTDSIVYTHIDNSESASHKWDVDDFVDISKTIKSLYDEINVKSDDIELVNVYYKLVFTQLASCKYNVILRKAYKANSKKELKQVRKYIVKLLPKSNLSLKDKVICFVLVSSNSLYRAYIVKRDPTMKIYEQNVKAKLK